MKLLYKVTLLLALLLAGCQPIMPEAAHPGDDKIANAMSAGLPSIAHDATIVDLPTAPGGDLVELRKGSNQWTCTPDLPFTPTNDPMCMDANGLEFFRAYLAGRQPQYSGIGIIYMLQGQSVASNDDPSLMEPPAGEEWVIDGPHIMIVSPDPLDPALFSSKHLHGVPYVMFAGTPYEHLMVPFTEEMHH
ncbi:MAG: hypothetical protein U0175_32940 [Caldilineaceae bacterium]